MDVQTTLALYRTRLAERRTAMSQVQLGFVLVTVPITLHAGFMMLADRHAVTQPVLLSIPGTVLAVIVIAGGLGLLVSGVRDLFACAAHLRALKRRIETDLGNASSDGIPRR